MFSRFAKQMTSQCVELIKSRTIPSDGRTSHRIIKALRFTDWESSGRKGNASEEQNAEGLSASTVLADTWTPGPSQAAAQDCGSEPLPGQRSTPPAGDVDIDGQKRQMLQQMEKLQIALQMKMLLKKQEAEQKMKLEQKKLESELEEQHILDLTTALSQNRAFQEQEMVHQTTPADFRDVDIDGRKWQMLQQMEILQITLQMRILLEKQEAEQKMKLEQKKLESELEEQRILDLITALSQNRAFQEQEMVHQTNPADSTDGGMNPYMLLKALPFVVLGAGAAAYAVPIALTAVGYTSSGIAAKSLAAYMMKVSALHYGGGVPAGGAVAILQSWGATAGVSYLNGAIGGSYVFYNLLSSKKDDDKLKKN